MAILCLRHSKNALPYFSPFHFDEKGNACQSNEDVFYYAFNALFIYKNIDIRYYS